jgi:hypothetical protein
MDRKDDIAAIALLTREDVANLGATLKRLYRLEDTSDFDALLEALDEAHQPQSG